MNRDSDLVVGVDLGGTKIAAALVDADGQIVSDLVTRPTPAQEGPEAMLNTIASLVTTVVSNAQADSPGCDISIQGVGIGAAGMIDIATGTVISATESIKGWKGTKVAEGIASRLESAGLGLLPVFVDNDVNAYAAGEAWRGAGRGADIVLVAAVGTGVGGAIVINGTTVTGRRGVAGEIGHLPVRGAEGQRCTCGRDGHLEAIAAGPQIYRRYIELGGDPSKAATTKDLRLLAESGDEIACRVYRDSAEALGVALAGLAATIDPDVIIISGGVAGAGEIWWAPLEKSFRAELIEPLKDIDICQSNLGTNAPIIGAAYGAFRLAASHASQCADSAKG